MIRKGRRYMTRAEYAEHQGVTPRTVTWWVYKGWIERAPDGWIDVVRADALIKPHRAQKDTEPVTLDELARRALERDRNRCPGGGGGGNGKVFLSVKEYARYRDVHYLTVYKWLKTRWIEREPDGRIDVARADAMLRETGAYTVTARDAIQPGATVKVKVRRYKKQKKLRVRRDPAYRHAAPVFDEPRDVSAWFNPGGGDFENL